MTLINFDYRVDKNINTVLIDTEHWIQDSSNIVQRYKISGRSVITYLTEIQDKFLNEKFSEVDSILEKGEIVLLSKIASEVARDRAFNINGGKYYNVPVMQVLGHFKDKIISFDSLNLLYDKILIEKLNPYENELLQSENKTMIGRILKIGTHRFDHDWNSQPLKVHVGDIVLIKDNVTTKITIGQKDYYVTEEGSVVGIFRSSDKLSLENLNLINECILMQEYRDSKLLGSSILATPNINYDILDWSDVYNGNLFQVVLSDQSVNSIHKDDVVLLDRSITTYAYSDHKKYFLINGTQYISAKIG